MKKDFAMLLDKLTSINEQNNGLEAIGDLPDDSAVTSTPMDEVDVDDETVDTDEQPETTDVTPVDDGGDTGGELDETTDTDTDDTTGDELDVEPDGEGGEVEVDDDVIDGNPPATAEIFESEDPHQVANRKIKIAEVLLSLYETVDSSITLLANGPVFRDKPVILEELNDLLDSITLTIEIINKVEDHSKLLYEYGVYVQSYKEIISKVNITEDK